MAFEVIRFRYLIGRERKSYLDLIITNANKAVYHFFLGAWIHYVKIRREKRELVGLANAKVNHKIGRASCRERV